MSKLLIGWVAIQYHWILDESVQYLGESEGRAKYKQDESNLQWYWMATHPMKNLWYVVHYAAMIINLWPACSSSHWILDGLPYENYSGSMSVQ